MTQDLYVKRTLGTWYFWWLKGTVDSLVPVHCIISYTKRTFRYLSFTVACRKNWQPLSIICYINLHFHRILWLFILGSFDVHKSMHHHMIPIFQSTRCNSFTSLLLDVYVWLIMFLASPRPSSGACNCTWSLWFYRWREAAGALLVVQLYVPDDDGREDARNMLSHT